MKKLSKKGWLLFLGIAFLLPAVCFGLIYWYNNRIAPLPYYGENYSIAQREPYYRVPAFVFVNQDNQATSNAFTGGRIWVAHYFFTTCPTICPKMIKGMGEVQQAYAGNDQVRLVSLTVDPERDQPAVLQQYAAAHQVNGRQWQLLTGDKKDLYRFARKGLFIVATDGDGGPGDFIHSDKLVLIDRDSHIRGYYDGTEPGEVRLLINDINRLLLQ